MPFDWKPGFTKDKHGRKLKSKYYIYSDQGYTVSKSFVEGVPVYQCWRRGELIAGRVLSADKAKGICENDYSKRISAENNSRDKAGSA